MNMKIQSIAKCLNLIYTVISYVFDKSFPQIEQTLNSIFQAKRFRKNQNKNVLLFLHLIKKKKERRVKRKKSEMFGLFLMKKKTKDEQNTEMDHLPSEN